MTIVSDDPAGRPPALAFRRGRFSSSDRPLPEEVAVAISIDGSTHAVMMATPRDLEDLGIGLALAERIVASPDEIETIGVVKTEAGLDCQIRLAPERGSTYVARRGKMTGPVGCGLCGVESLELAAPELPAVRAEPSFAPSLIAEAMEAMARGQALGRLTRALHAAAFFVPGEGTIVVREDVGRHNALDKVAGHLARNGISAGAGFVTVTSRVSVELIQKAAVMGTALLAAVSVPTVLAVRTAQAAGITLVAVARGDEFEVFTHPRRLLGAQAGEGASHVPHDKLVHMANQIAVFCASNPNGARHTADVADHINKFWDPRMREKLVEKAEAGETGGMHRLVIEAIARIRRVPISTK